MSYPYNNINNNTSNNHTYSPPANPHAHGSGYHPSHPLYQQPQQVGGVNPGGRQSSHSHAPELTHAGFNPQGQAGYAGDYSGQGIAQSPVSGYAPSGLPIPVAHHGHIPHGSIPHGQPINSFPGGHSVATHHGHSYYHAQPSSQYTLHPVGHQAPSSSSSQPAQPTHRCDICDQTFTRGGDLKRHRDSVHSERLHKCTICQKTYTRTDSLTRHMNDSHA
ncbi:uncharacterized protein STEHIDRAFT_114054 [Stereum hirsutum FP-91666 SS1]|uniref:uncharacterized protein n=1 Tax=Stereum hirsutum (strain FP-91666) TaxID=721885 RepID=UPI000444A252|nr:uncharacterized protein STEHIDRAFT_114054 [Stereum hirsutum FP-91666 SS1]EIM83006.1 hypothetical protein STEHIDRAFT_114054 [Stereum hirsutum FP-91666 SS1]